MTEQEIVDLFARAAKPRLMDLLKLKIKHRYAESTVIIEGQAVQFKSVKSIQPYRDIERFTADDKIISFVVDPGLLPIVKAISMDIRARKLLVTRKIPAREEDKGVIAQLDHFGIRLMMYFDYVSNEMQLVWEALYGFA